MKDKKPVVNKERGIFNFCLGTTNLNDMYQGGRFTREDFHKGLDEILDEVVDQKSIVEDNYTGYKLEPFGEVYFTVDSEYDHDSFSESVEINAWQSCYTETKQEHLDRVRSEEKALFEYKLKREEWKKKQVAQRKANLEREVEQLEQTLAKKRSELES